MLPVSGPGMAALFAAMLAMESDLQPAPETIPAQTHASTGKVQ
jgi:hypothetical protein